MVKATESTALEKLGKVYAYVRCDTCAKNGQKVQILASVRSDEQFDHDGHIVDYWNKYQVLRCGGCETIFFRSTHASSDDVDFNYDHEGKETIEYVVSERIYPDPPAVRDTIKGFRQLPDQLQAIYSESSKALLSSQPVLAGIGIRAVLETICKDKQAPGKDLYQKIDGLRDLGYLSIKGAAILHKLRVLGNAAAHEVKPHHEEQLALAFDVLDNLLRDVYILEPAANRSF